MNDKQFVAKQKMLGKNDPDAEMTPMMEDSDYKHEKGYGGMGSCPVKFVKREGTLEGRQAMHDCGHLMKMEKGPQSNYD